jgi:hypothetical protein
VVLPVRSGPQTISPQRPKWADRFRWASRRPVVTTSRTAGVLHDQQPGVVRDAVVVIGDALVMVQSLPDLAVEQLRHCGHLAANCRQPASVVSARS